MEDFLSDDNELTPVLTASRSSGKSSPPQKTDAEQNKDDHDGQLTVDIYQTDDDIVIQSTIAGVDQNDIDISITNDKVNIKGHRVSPETIKPSDYYYQELFWGPFSRIIILPEDIDPSSAKASMRNGLLTIRLPKLSKSGNKK